MKQNTIETLVGVVILIIAALFLNFAYQKSNTNNIEKGYNVIANFQDIDGIVEGADVKIAGIKVGYVEDVILNSDTYYAGIRLYIDEKVEIPIDSRAIIATSGLLGSKFIRINPGGSEYNLSDTGKIKFTQSALNIEDLIGKLMYSLTSK